MARRGHVGGGRTGRGKRRLAVRLLHQLGCVCGGVWGVGGAAGSSSVSGLQGAEGGVCVGDCVERGR